jgi:DNA adenine methylase
MDKQMKITAIAPWFGSKRTLAPKIVKELGPHDNFFETFCGSMAVLLVKEPSRQETVCDLHGHLTNLAWVIQDGAMAAELYDRLTRTLFCESMLVEAIARLKANTPSSCLPDIESAYWFFIHSWCGRNGTSGSKRMSFAIAVAMAR